jgi:hypothetical protein
MFSLKSLHSFDVESVERIECICISDISTDDDEQNNEDYDIKI